MLLQQHNRSAANGGWSRPYVAPDQLTPIIDMPFLYATVIVPVIAVIGMLELPRPTKVMLISLDRSQ
mgnify:CR=1 FL=1